MSSNVVVRKCELIIRKGGKLVSVKWMVRYVVFYIM